MKTCSWVLNTENRESQRVTKSPVSLRLYHPTEKKGHGSFSIDLLRTQIFLLPFKGQLKRITVRFMVGYFVSFYSFIHFTILKNHSLCKARPSASFPTYLINPKQTRLINSHQFPELMSDNDTGFCWHPFISVEWMKNSAPTHFLSNIFRVSLL